MTGSPSPPKPAPNAASLPSLTAPACFTIKARDGRARAGVLATPRHGSLETPAALLYTRRGFPMSLTPDMIATLDPPVQGYQVDVMQL